VLANAVLEQQYSPASAVEQYLGATETGNAATAWAAAQIEAPAKPVDAKLLNQAALQAALAGTRANYQGLGLGTTTFGSGGGTATVGYSYRRLGATHQAAAIVERDSNERRLGFYPVWRVVVSPALLSFNLPPGGGTVSIDGQPLSLPTGKTFTVAVLPLPHRVELQASAMLQGDSQSVDSTDASGVETKVSFSAKLTASGTQKAGDAIKAAFAVCAAATSLRPEACPQSDSQPLADQPRWQLIGDPTADLAVALDASQQLAATGYYQMIFGYHPTYGSGTEHDAIGGGYRALLRLTSTDVQPGSLAPATDLPAASRPSGATDQAATDLVAKALTACAAATSAEVNDCPQLTTLSVTNPTNLHWTLTGDPVAGATVSFDGARSVLTVSGNFSMGIDFDMSGGHFHETSPVNRYRADLFWNGSALQLVTIVGAE
jgi:hypothetical protein